ncbi:MAG: RIP metalloprotease RseP, partial [Sulfuricellaceae bacterium]|nr:RIP metalloprotease RseP [Sulfuricellaceae bacterium]
MNLLFTLAAFALALAILIVVHELGHYWVARRCGVKVLRFSVGFGKPLFIYRAGSDQTEWVLSAFPLGGYVKMLDENEAEVSPEERPRAFNRQPVWKRMAIVSAGPAANFLLAVFLYWALFTHGIPGMRPVLGDIPQASAAAKAGLMPMDELTSIAGEKIVTWQDVRWSLARAIGRQPVVEVSGHGADGRRFVRQLVLSDLDSKDMEQDFLGKLGLTLRQPIVKPLIGDISPGGSAAHAGLLPGDEIIAVNGSKIARWEDLVKWVQSSPGQLQIYTVKRLGNELKIPVTPAVVDENGAKIGRIGAAPQIDKSQMRSFYVEARYSPPRALLRAIEKTWETSRFSLDMMGRMVIGRLSWKNISGPITIAEYAGQTAHM